MKFICEFKGDIPGVSEKECGNYLEHDLPNAKVYAKDMCNILDNWNEDKLNY